MPHSSGGGSHGGGFHSSSSASRSSSGSSRSYSGGGGGFSAQPIRHSYYAGATRYVWYGRNGSCRSLYQKGAHEKPSLGTTIGVLFVISLVAVPIICFLLALGLVIPKALDTNSYNANIVIEDPSGFTTGSGLQEALVAFREKTGVTPGVEIVPDESWKEHYTDLQTYALSEYLRLFDDEKHWLVVLSWPTGTDAASFTDWSWEGMIGDECRPAINSDAEAAFTETVHRHLLRAAPETVGEELARAYTEFSATGMEIQIRVGFLVAAVVLLAVYAFLIAYFIRDYRDAKRILEAVAAPANAKEYNCEYCGSLYVSGTVTRCPNCGAPIPAHAEEKK